MARHGRRPPPAPAARPVGFSPATNHATCFPPVLRRLQREQLEARPTGFSRITKHETRLLSPWVREGWRHQKPPSGPLRPPASHCFPVHDCSPLFTIVRHCSAKNIVSEPVSVPAALAVAAAAPFAGNTACWVFTRHETRFFPVPPATPRRATPSPANGLFTNHESRPLCFCRCFPARCGAASGCYGAAWAAVVPRAGNTACWVFTSHESRNMVFPLPSGDSKESNSKPDQQVFTNHETRITNHESRPLCLSSHDFPRFPTISRHFPLFFGPPLPPESVSARRPPPRARCRPQNRARQSPCPPYVSPASIMTGANQNGGCPAHRTLITI